MPHAGDVGLEPSPGLESLASGVGKAAEAPLEAPKMVIPDLPWTYADDRVVLLVRDPRTLFAYWDLRNETVEGALAAVPGGQFKLRLLAFARTEPVVVRELDIDIGGRSFYLYDCEPNRDYRIELIVRGPDGRERIVAHASNVATLPPNRPSSWVEDRFVSLRLDLPLVGASVVPGGHPVSDNERRLHARSYELSGGDVIGAEGNVAPSSSQGIVQGFGGRSWSGTLQQK